MQRLYGYISSYFSSSVKRKLENGTIEDESLEDSTIKQQKKHRTESSSSVEEKNEDDDNFVKIVNSLTSVDYSKLDKDGNVINGENKVYLEYKAEDVNVFQFPKKTIYIRDCYCDMFRNICKIMSCRPYINRIIITGQPGIGKTSFIYVLLFFLKSNLSNNVNPDETELLKQIELIKEQEHIKRVKSELLDEERKRKEILAQEIHYIEKDNEESQQLINDYEKEINKYYNQLNNIISGKDVDVTPKVDSTQDGIYTFTLFNEIIKIDVSNENNIKHIKKHCLDNIKNIENFIKGNSRIVGERIDSKKLSTFEGIVHNERNKQYKRYINAYVVSSSIMHCIDEIDKLKNSIILEDSRKGMCINDISMIENSLQSNSDISLDKVSSITLKYDEMRKLGFNYYILDEKVWKRKIYVVKGKRYQNLNERKIYEFKDNCLSVSHIRENDMKDSIIIVDTFNGKFGSNNIIISISSPDIHNNKFSSYS